MPHFLHVLVRPTFNDFRTATILFSVLFKNSNRFLSVTLSFWILSSSALADNAPKKLSDWPIYSTKDSNYLAPIDYALKQPAFSDYALKKRKIYLPNHTKIHLNEKSGVIDYPIGTIIEKQFYFLTKDNSDCLLNGYINALVDNQPQGVESGFICRVETRLLRRDSTGWQPFVYIWDKNQQDVFLAPSGGSQTVTLNSASFGADKITYQIPSLGECSQCHMGALGLASGFEVIGPSLLRRLDLSRSNLSLSSALMPAQPVIPVIKVQTDGNEHKTETLEGQAREYLDINCAHCHNPKGLAASSALFLGLDQNLDVNFGICKRVVASGTGFSGNLFSIVPGQPLQSILINRMQSTQSKIKMPELGRNSIDHAGVLLISEWIKTLKGDC